MHRIIKFSLYKEFRSTSEFVLFFVEEPETNIKCFFNFQTCRVEREGTNMNAVHLEHFPPGSVIAFDITMEPPVKKVLGKLRYLLIVFFGDNF